MNEKYFDFELSMISAPAPEAHVPHTAYRSLYKKNKFSRYKNNNIRERAVENTRVRKREEERELEKEKTS